MDRRNQLLTVYSILKPFSALSRSGFFVYYLSRIFSTFILRRKGILFNVCFFIIQIFSFLAVCPLLSIASSPYRRTFRILPSDRRCTYIQASRAGTVAKGHIGWITGYVWELRHWWTCQTNSCPECVSDSEDEKWRGVSIGRSEGSKLRCRRAVCWWRMP